jgi:serine/threonine-protein kinase
MSVQELNRDLLTAMLAVLTGAVPREGLVATLKAWSQNRQTPLTELLGQASGLDADKLRVLETLAALHLHANHDDLRQSLDALNAQGLTVEVLTVIDDDNSRIVLSKTLGCELTVPLAQDAAASPGSTHPLPRTTGERFQLIRPHASGGIGQVWLARDCELQREVAVKEIQPRFAERAEQRVRFVLEAEITGNLEHPGIVPVYSLGRNAEGRPYYAMRFIRGESFAVAIRRFHDSHDEQAGSAPKRTRTILKWGVEFRQLVGRFLDVCDAIDYAHSRGILHRDLKPANVMLGPYGETLVVDWGLAKVLGKSDLVRPETDGESGTGAPDESGASPGRTEHGTTIGTPAYMSPEQASGQIDQLGPASDVYSLGASLYELLTGQPAFRQAKVVEMIEKVVAGDFPPPRAVDRSIPAPLDAICLKAMAKDKAARYTSVRELAQDLERWLADAPVVAFPERRLARVGRWLRQHRTWAYAGAATLAGIAVVASIAVVTTDAARRSETNARKEAETNFDMAQQAVEQYLTNVSENALLKEQDSVDLRTLRHDLLKSALAYYEKFTQERQGDPRLRRQLAKAYFRVGQITAEIGSVPRALDALRAAAAIWEPLVKAHPSDRGLASLLARCDLALGKTQSASGDYSSAMTRLSESRSMLERLAALDPSEAAYQSDLADCYIEIGIVHSRLDQAELSLAIHEKAMKIQRELLKRFPDNLLYQRGLVESLNAIGYAHYRGLDCDSALRAFHEAEDTCQGIMKQHASERKPAWLLNLLALSLYNIGSTHRQQGKREEALPALKQALSCRLSLAEQHPSVTRFKEKLGLSYREIAELEHEVHQDANARQMLEKSVAIYQELVRAQPDQTSFHGELALSWNYLGIIHDEARRTVEAIQPFEHAINEQETAINTARIRDEHKLPLCYYLDNLGEQYVDLGRVTDGLPYYERALQVNRELSTAKPEKRDWELELVKRLVALGTIKRHQGDSMAARPLFAEAKSVVERLLAASPGDSGLQTRLVVALDNEANTFADLGQHERARPLLEQAAALFRRGPDHQTPGRAAALDREARSEVLWDLARVLQTLGMPDEASRAAADRNALCSACTPDELAALSLKETGRAVLIGFGKTEISERAKVVRKLDLDQAADNLQLAIARGFKDLRRLEAHPDAPFLLARDELESALARLRSSERGTAARSSDNASKP